MPKSENCFLDQESWIKARTLNPQKLGHDVWADCYRQLVRQRKQGQDAKISAGRRLKMLCDFLELHGIAPQLAGQYLSEPETCRLTETFFNDLCSGCEPFGPDSSLRTVVTWTYHRRMTPEYAPVAVKPAK